MHADGNSTGSSHPSSNPPGLLLPFGRNSAGAEKKITGLCSATSGCLDRIVRLGHGLKEAEVTRPANISNT